MIRRLLAHNRWPRFSPHYFVRLARISGADVHDCACGARMFRERGATESARQVVIERDDPRAGTPLWDLRLLRGLGMDRGSFYVETPQPLTLEKSAGGLH